MTILPTSWCEIEFDEGFESISSNTNKIKQKSYLSIGEIPVIDQGENFISGYTNDPDSLVKISSPLIGFGDHTRRFKFITHPFAIGADGLKLIKPINNLLNPKFAYYQLLNTKIEDRGYSRHYQYLRKSKFNLAPLNEQTRIVDKIDELFSELDNGIEELETAQRKLELYRQSLLQSAVEGELSKEWRETQTEISETGEQLLVRILKERRERWEQEKLKEFADKGKNPPKDWQDKYPEPVQPDTDNLPQLPEGWVWASLDMIGEIVSGVAKGTKRATPVPMREVPYLRVANVQRGYLDLSEIKTILATEKDIEQLTLKEGDILFNEGGDRDKLGRGWIWKSEIEECIHQNHVFRCRLYDPNFVPELISYHGNTFGKLWFERAGKQTTNLASINMGILKRFPVPVIPVLEQKFIFDYIQSNLDIVDAQLEQNSKLIKNCSRQRTNILNQAFKGKLVPQDPNDEHAQVLLERIQQQREAEALLKKSSPQKRSTSKAKKEVGMSQSILEILQQQSDWISGQELAELFGINGSSDITDIENFYHELKTLTIEEKISVKPDNELFKTQDLFKYLG
ncbi:restriction endonuclease subunit S [Acinetobacter seifertii]|uniref:restriction endonuclease subunit S n=1 Tax=Acinetobacter seifertii TaxID=1530123 RepID=UPI003AF627D2